MRPQDRASETFSSSRVRSWVDSLSLHEQRELLNLLSQTVWIPQPGPQTQAYLSHADHLFYGGAAGGGKTDLLLGTAYNQHSRAVIFRREYAQLEALIERSKEIFEGKGEYRDNPHHIWRFHERGNTLEFGAVQRPGDEQKWQGRPHDFKGFDEITHFLETQFRYLCGWVRTTKRGQRTRVAAAGNPPSSLDGQWVKRYWSPWLVPGHSPGAQPGELLWYTTLKGEDFWVEHGHRDMRLEMEGEFLIPLSRTFIPAKLDDNKFINPEYRAQLQAMPEPLRSQLLYGDMQVEAELDPWQLIPEALLEPRCLVDLSYSGSQRIEQVGVDCARGGRDETVIFLRSGSLLLPPISWPGKATENGPKTAGLIYEELKKRGATDAAVVVDIIGVGAAVYDALKGLLPRVYGFNAAEASKFLDRTKKLKMVNNRAEMHWNFREWLDDPTDPLYLPRHPKLKADLLSPRWELTPRGVKVEDKDSIKERLGRSPDYGDAAMMACVNLNATDWRGLLEFAKEELAEREKKRREAERAAGKVSDEPEPEEPKAPPSARELMEKFGSMMKG